MELKSPPGIALKTLFAKPKGSGWEYIIDFVHTHKNRIGLQNINKILPLLDDWNNKARVGKITKKASQIALFYYEEMSKNNIHQHGRRGEKKGQLIRVILNGASEISDELKTIFDEVISKKQTSFSDRYYDIVKTILTSVTDSIEAIKSLPLHVIQLSDLFWYQGPRKPGRFGDPSIGVEKYFGLSDKHDFDYFPASAFQTPVFQLLRFAPQETMDFIISFTNKCIEFYAKSGFDSDVKEVEVFADENPIKQYISNRLWNMYRGTQVSTYLLESIHMALEKWMLQIAKTTSKEILESWCLYLINNSKSSSITAVVSSLVIAEPSKLFNIAKIIFRTKEFFIYDTTRFTLDQAHKSQLLSLKSYFPRNYQNELYENERIDACDESHRKWSLEQVALKYQLFKSENEIDDAAKDRQDAIWEILDNYYRLLPDKAKESGNDKTWRLYLARMGQKEDAN